ncbi:MAG: nucleotidyltransferase domain-containing protein [Bacteroidales bacterium]|nr:nucleotidyltransferase domain-containing protein [Bacteroidales bacterium]MCF8458770.1 nucleotidyltransferase domain-containing protein [Bacteroidales bacterium]
MNTRHHLFSTVKERIRKIDLEAQIILFGSRARNDFHDGSD